MTVEVEFSDKAILSVKVVDHVETEGIGTAAVDKMPARILIAQGTDVDVVSSATVSSEAILEAVRDCIKQASK
jgi:fumarate reductase flavoprotein subunit